MQRRVTVAANNFGVVTPDILKTYDGLGFLQAMVTRTLPQPSIAELPAPRPHRCDLGRRSKGPRRRETR